MKKIYITKYALTKGILEAEAVSINSSGFSTIKLASFDPSYIDYPAATQILSNKDYEISKEQAILVGNEMRVKKIKSLRNQLEKLNQNIIRDNIVPII